MKNRDLVQTHAKLRDAYAFALRTREWLANPEAVEDIHSKLSNLAQPVVPEQRELTTLVSEAE